MTGGKLGLVSTERCPPYEIIWFWKKQTCSTSESIADFSTQSKLFIEQELDRRENPSDDNDNGDDNDNNKKNKGKDAAKTPWAYL